MSETEPVFNQIDESEVSLVDRALSPIQSSMERGDRPLPHDVVLGGKSPLTNAAVLGGIAGVKWRLNSDVEALKIAAIKDALKYGKEGLKIIYQVLKYESLSIQLVAYELLMERANPQQKEVLQKYNPLISSVGIDYTRLRNLLGDGKWQEADEETAKVMYKAADGDKWNHRRLLETDIEQFPYRDLRIINQLWIKYSFSRYSFSIQKQIWQSTGGNEELFKQRVGWNYGHASIALKPPGYQCPDGHLPHLVYQLLAQFGSKIPERKGLGYIMAPLFSRSDL